jgi:hypothetical protein
MKKSPNMPVGSRTWFWLRIIVQFVVAGEWHNNVSDCPIIMIGPGGLLLVVPHLFAVRVLLSEFQLVSWVGVARKKITKLGCEKYFCWVTY